MAGLEVVARGIPGAVVGRLGASPFRGSALREILEREVADLDAAIEGGVRGTANDLKATMRAQTRLGFRGAKLANAWQARHYEKGRRAASLVYPKARRIFELAERGGAVEPTKGDWLAIPRRRVIRSLSGNTRGRGGQNRIESHIGKKGVFFLPIKGGRELLLVRQTGRRTNILFHLYRKTKHEKRTDFAGASKRAGDRLASEIVERMPR